MSWRLCRGTKFFASPGKWRLVLGHDNLSKRYQVPIDGCELSCQDETVQMASKKQDTSASAGSPIDFVSVAGTVRVAQDLTSWLNFPLIDLGGRLRSSPGCRSQLIKPTELYVGLTLKLSGCARALSSSL